MLEASAGPRAARTFWLLAAFAGLAVAVTGPGVSTREGYYPATAVGGAIAAAAAVRVIGLSVAAARGRSAMGFGWRVLSWLALGGPLALVGAIADPILLVPAGLLVALDLVTALVAPRGEAERPARRRRRTRVLVPLLVLAALAGLVAVHVLWASRVEGGELIDWAYVCLVAAIALRYAILPARRGPEEAAHPLPAVRRHEPRSRPVPDPGREAAVSAVTAFRAKGDVEPLLRYVEGFGLPDLPERVRALLSRPKTTREEDLAAVAEALEKALVQSAQVPTKPPRQGTP